MEIKKSESTGNTLKAAICTLFGCHQNSIVIDPIMQHGNCGTVIVNGTGYDWSDRGDKYTFILAQ